MAELKFQDKLLSLIDKLTIETLPHTICIAGDVGSGKHTLCSIIKEKFNFENSMDITDKISLELIQEIEVSVTRQLYIIDTQQITVKEQNVILKLLEEPVQNAYLILLCSNLQSLLTTVYNRCYILSLDKYKEEDLKTFQKTDNDLICKISKTPGQVIQFEDSDLNGMFNLATTIVNNIKVANPSNTLSKLPSKLQYKDEQGFPVELFVRVMHYVVYCKAVADSRYAQAYELTNSLFNNLYIPHIDKQELFENYLLRLGKVIV